VGIEMSGFAASGRIERVSPRLARRADRDPAARTNGEDVTELVEVRAEDPLVDRWAAVRDRWSELTFYLFDPQSWRR
jgi:hypothetical protein